MIALCISLDRVRGADELLASMADQGVTGLDVRVWAGVEPPGADTLLKAFGLHWNWPRKGSAVVNGPIHLQAHAYSGSHAARIGCFLAHYTCWRWARDHGQPVAVFEDDALFIRAFDPKELTESNWRWGMVSLNDPRGATRKASAYAAHLQSHRHLPIVPVPWIDDRLVPQGLPGHSAYVIWPDFADELIAFAHKYGAMPNDALANKQWFPDRLGCLTRPATKVSGRKSLMQ